jgi:hypothetical protein
LIDSFFQDVQGLGIEQVFEEFKNEFNRHVLVYQEPEKAFCLGDYAAFGKESSLPFSLLCKN